MLIKLAIIILGLLFLIPCCLFAVDFDVEFPPPCGPDGAPFGYVYIRILMDNNDLNRQHFRLPIVIYSWGNTIDYVNYLHSSNGYGSTASIGLYNGFEPGGFWESGVQIYERNWDNHLPDSLCFYVENSASGDGWPVDLGMQEYLAINLNISSSIDPYGYNAICIDSAAFGDPYNWLWEDPSPPFDGPYCVNLTHNCAMPPYIVNCPSTMATVSYRKKILRAFTAEDGSGSWITEWQVYGHGTITPNGHYSATYEYMPAPEDYGDTLTVSICAATQWFSCPGASDCTFEIYVRGPVCGDANDDGDFNLLDILYLIGAIYNNPPGETDYDPMVVDVNSDGDINLIDILLMIQNLYGPGSVELNCTFD